MKKTVAIIGGGASALILACELDPLKFNVSIYEKNSALGRKFLVAGEGGLNLTHSENKIDFLSRYSPQEFLENAFLHFSNRDFILLLNNYGIETYVGSSGRVFPKKGLKPIEVFNIFFDKIKEKNVAIKTKQQWKGFDKNDELIFETNSTVHHVKSDYVIFCLGGASWPVTGSAGDWLQWFNAKKISTHIFQASNCAFKINWPEDFNSLIFGKALKNCAFTCGNKTQRGEAVITSFGIEGSGVYPLSGEIRKQLEKEGSAELTIDLKPSSSEGELLKKINKGFENASYTQHISKQLNLNKLQISLVKSLISKEDFLDSEKLIKHIKCLKLKIRACDEIENAISTVGGISLEEISADFELKKMPNHFVVGEMLDFDAPTGGYLLQACFTMGKFLADHLNLKA